MKRKEFIRQSSLAAASVFLSPALMTSKKNEDTILGHNNKRYRINTKWSKADAMKNPSRTVMRWYRIKKEGSFY